MRGKIKTEKGKTVYEIDGKRVTRAAFDKAFPDKPIGEFGGQLPGCWPMASEGMAVHPEQIKDAMERDHKQGVPTNYDGEGRPVFRDRDHRKRYLRSYAVHDNNGGYGD